MNWLTERFRKKEEQEMYPVHDWRGALVCEAWKPDTWSISYLLWAEPKGYA